MANIVEIVIKAVDKTQKDFGTAITNLKSFEKAASVLTTGVVGAGVAVAGAIAVMTEKSIESADEMGKLAQKAGMPVNQFSKLAYAASLTDTAIETLSLGVKGLNHSIVEAAGSINSGAAKAFDALGISIRDSNGNLKSNHEILLEVADRFASYKDGAEKAALAQAIFGKSGQDLIPMLNEGRAGLEALESETNGVTDATSKQAQEFNDNLTRLKKQMGGIGATVAAELLPHLLQFTDWLVKTNKETGVFQAIALTAIDVLKGMAVSVYLVWTVLKALGQIIGQGSYIAYQFFYGILFNAIAVLTSIGESIVAVVKGIINLGEAAGNVGQILYDFFQGNFKEAWEGSKSTVEQMKQAVVKVGTDIAISWETNGKIAGDTMLKAYDNIKAASQSLSADLKGDLSDFANFATNLWTAKPKTPTDEHEQPKANAPVLSNVEEIDRLEKRRAEMLLRLRDLELEMQTDVLRGGERLIAEEDRRYQKRLETIAKESEDEQKSIELANLAAEEHEQRLNEIKQQGLAIRADMEEAFKNGQIERYIELQNTQAALDKQGLEERQEYLQTYAQMFRESHRGMFSYVAEATQTIYGGLTRALTGIITGAVKAKEAFKQLGMMMVEMIVGFMVKRVAAWVLEKSLMALGLATAKAITVATVADAAAIAGAWAAAATAASIATFGAATAAGATVVPMMAANAAAGSSIAMTAGTLTGGVAHGGLDFVPREATYLLQQGEAVLQPEMNKDLREFLAQQGGGMVHVTINLDSEPIYKGLHRASRDGRLVIDARAIV